MRAVAELGGRRIRPAASGPAKEALALADLRVVDPGGDGEAAIAGERSRSTERRRKQLLAGEAHRLAPGGHATTGRASPLRKSPPSEPWLVQAAMGEPSWRLATSRWMSGRSGVSVERRISESEAEDWRRSAEPPLRSEAKALSAVASNGSAGASAQALKFQSAPKRPGYSVPVTVMRRKRASASPSSTIGLPSACSGGGRRRSSTSARRATTR